MSLRLLLVLLGNGLAETLVHLKHLGGQRPRRCISQMHPYSRIGL